MPDTNVTRREAASIVPGERLLTLEGRRVTVERVTTQSDAGTVTLWPVEHGAAPLVRGYAEPVYVETPQAAGRYTVEIDGEGHVSYWRGDSTPGKWFDASSPRAAELRALLGQSWDDIGSDGYPQDDEQRRDAWEPPTGTPREQLGQLVDRYRTEARVLREQGRRDEAQTYAGMTEGLRIARRILDGDH